MIGFVSLEETLALGAPVVRLFRVTLRRDPDPVELDAYADMLRRGQDLTALAQHLTGAAQGAAALADLAESDPVVAETPLLPGLAPGAPPDDALAYRLWIALYDTPPAGVVAALPPSAGPLVSLAMTVGDSQIDAALRTARSLRAQTHAEWELLLATHIASPWPRRALADLSREDSRVRVVEGARREPPGAVLARAAEDGQGALFGLLRTGDTLAPTALHEMADALRRHPDALVLHSDEDVRTEGGERTAPRFKAAVSPDFAPSGDPLGQLALYRQELLAELGGLRAEAWPRQGAELAARAIARAGPARTHHVPAVLFHAAAPPPAPVPAPGAVFALPASPPLVSVIVPTRDHAALLACCARGVLAETRYDALELLVADNGSTDPDALALLARLAQDARVRVLPMPGPFNFAALNNAAAAQARGEVLLLLNNDIEVLEPLWLAHMVAHAMRPDVGAVGAKLLYPDGAVQHAGLLLGPDGAATHVGRHAAADGRFYLGQLDGPRDLSAVTGACLAMRAQVWAAVGGMDERLAVTWNDVDLCLRVRAAGLRVVWTPQAVLRHHESATRGVESADPARLARFAREQAMVRATWGDALDRDPFLNANLLAQPSGALVLTRPRRRRPWEDAAPPKGAQNA